MVTINYGTFNYRKVTDNRKLVYFVNLLVELGIERTGISRGFPGNFIDINQAVIELKDKSRNVI